MWPGEGGRREEWASKEGHSLPTLVAPYGARSCPCACHQATRTYGPRAMVLTQVKAAGLVQVFDLLALDLLARFPMSCGLLAFSGIDAPQPPLIQEGELLPRPGGGGTKCRRRGSAQVR